MGNAGKQKGKSSQDRAYFRYPGGNYPDAAPQLEFTNPFELLVATILSAQCTDKQVNKVTRALFPVYGTPEKMAKATEAELELISRVAACLKPRGATSSPPAASWWSNTRAGCGYPGTLTRCLGGRKTANVVLSNAFGKPAIAVDTMCSGWQPVGSGQGQGCDGNRKAADGKYSRGNLVHCPPLADFPRPPYLQRPESQVRRMSFAAGLFIPPGREGRKVEHAICR